MTERVVDVDSSSLTGLLASMNDEPLMLTARWSHRQPGDDVDWEVMAEYRLSVSSFLSWSYTVANKKGDVDYEASCDTTTYRRREGAHRVERRIPRRTSLDEPWLFFSWLAIPETWVVELVRPLDLLGLVLVDGMTPLPDSSGACRLDIRPIGREPSPYGGIAQPHRSTCTITLDLAQGAIREALVRQAGELTDHMEIISLHRSTTT